MQSKKQHPIAKDYLCNRISLYHNYTLLTFRTNNFKYERITKAEGD